MDFYRLSSNRTDSFRFRNEVKREISGPLNSEIFAVLKTEEEGDDVISKKDHSHTLSSSLSLSDSPSSLFCFKYRRVREPLIHRIAIYITPLYIRVSVCIGAYGLVCACELQRHFPTFHPKDFSFSFLFEIFLL